MPEIKAFTVEYSGLTKVLETDCKVRESCNRAEQRDTWNFKALWDTGAMGSVISTGVVNLLGLKPTGRAKIFHANGSSIVNTYFVDIVLPNNVVFPHLYVTEGDLSGTDVLIGMDIISAGDFSISSSLQKTKFSFQIPSTHDTDYVKEWKQ
jgi:hypothetical protein